VVAAQGPPRQTLPQFLGAQRFFQIVGLVTERIRNRLGTRFPNLEARPPVLAITDPANAQSDVPAVKAAAAAKAEEDAAPQKIKAIRYLAGLGCKECYPDTLLSLLKALDDCTESVRYEAARALRTLTDGPCKSCANGTCCTAEVTQKLEQVVNGRNDVGLPVEPSERVRRMARIALANCNCSTLPGEAAGEVEGPLPESDQPPAEGPIPEATGAPTPAAQAAIAPPRRAYDVVVARVNDQAIHQREIAERVERRLAGMRLQAGHRAEAEPSLKQQWFQEELEGAIDQALLAQEARTAPEFAGALVGFENEATGQAGASVRTLASAVISDHELAESWLRGQLRVDETVSADEIRAWYQIHREEFRRAAEVRWECVTATATLFGSPAAARAVLEELRQRAERLSPQGPPSKELQSLAVQAFDWTAEAAMPSPERAEALRRLPAGQASPIIEDAAGLHVVRVLARRPERLLPLEEAAPEIREQIVHERLAAPRRAYLDALRRRANLWTINFPLP
jgi:hypothetical protein